MFKASIDFIKNIFKSPYESNLKCLKDKEDARDLIKLTIPASTTSLNFSLSRFMPPITDQGNKGACVGFASATALFILLKRMLFITNRTNLKLPPLSPMWIYYFARQIDGLGLEDKGTSIRSGLKALKEYGAPLLKNMPYSYDVRKAPNDKILSSKVFKISGYYRILRSPDIINEVKTILSVEHLPIVIGLRLFKNQLEYAKYNKGYLNYPDNINEVDDYIGGHAVCLTGYKYDDKGDLWFECINSWGMYGNTDGFLYFPAKILVENNFNLDPIMDMWTFTKRYF